MNPQTLPSKKELKEMQHSVSEMLEDVFDMVAVLKAMQEIQENPKEDEWVSWEDLKKELHVS